MTQDHESAVKETAMDASLCKLSASTLGYYNDPFVQYFVKTPSRRMPLINRGYYARVLAIEQVVERFVQAHSSKVQIVILGAGLDTMYYRLRDQQRIPINCEYYELDFPEITQQKIMTIRRRKSLLTLLEFESTNDYQSACSLGGTALNIPGYHLLPGDLRHLENTRKVLENAGLDSTIPTLFVSEVVFVYMEPQYSMEWIQWSSTHFTDVSYVVYEQILPDDAFGRIMMQNINARGCSLLSISTYPTLEAQQERFQSHSFAFTQCWDMNNVYYKYLNENERLK